MATTREAVFARITTLCADSGFTRAVSPFDFDNVPTGVIDGCFRVTVEGGPVLGGFSFSEERNDIVSVWVARKHSADPQEAYERLVTDVSSLTRAVVRYGAQTWGEFAVPDGTTSLIEHENGREFAVARVAIPINYEVQL
jgi:hypothetical protein